MKGCSNCKHYVSKLGDQVNAYGQFEIYRKCQLGYEQTMIEWWRVNGHTPTSEIISNLGCHEYHESTLLLMDMNEKVDELLSFLQKKL